MSSEENEPMFRSMSVQEWYEREAAVLHDEAEMAKENGDRMRSATLQLESSTALLASATSKLEVATNGLKAIIEGRNNG